MLPIVFIPGLLCDERLVADGLWLSDVFGNKPVPMEQRRVIGALMGASPLPPEAA